MGGEMKPCAHCGSAAVGVQHPTGKSPFIVGCQICGAQTKFFASSSDAIAAWNRRSPDPELVEALESHARALDAAFATGVSMAVIDHWRKWVRALLSRIREGGEG